jgi:pimeloyl-ACP methyl ester carboxylesterase
VANPAVSVTDRAAGAQRAAEPGLEQLARALHARRAAGSPLRPGERALVVFDGGAGAWTAVLDGPRMQLARGRAPNATTTILADAATLAAVVDGSQSGVHAFLDGRLRIRGNMALALQLDGFDHPGRPVRLPRARTVRAHDIDTFYLEAGHGPAVVLLHGLGATNASMLPTLAELSRDHRVLAPDLPGFGDSSKPVRPYHAAFFARWLSAFLDAVGVRRAHVIGNSMGGRAAIETALRAPERVDRLVLYAPSMAFRRLRLFTPIVRLLAAEMAAFPMVVPRGYVLTVLRSMFARPERVPDAWHEAAVDEFLRVFSTPRGRIAFFSAARQIYLEEAYGQRGFWDRLPSLSRPALFIWGNVDRLVPVAFARHVEAAVPHARSVVLDDCGHVPQFEHPTRTHALVRDFLSAADGGPPERPATAHSARPERGC